MSTKRAIYEIANFKASTDSPGEFTADVSVFGNVDLQGDRVMPGAFTKSLKEWNLSGNPIPVIWNHNWDDPFAHIGYVTHAVETPKALRITGKNDIGKPFASQVHDLLLSRRVTGMSFAYEVEADEPAKDGATNLTQLRIIEAGPTLQGANPSAQLVSAKSLLEAAATVEAGEPVTFGDVEPAKTATAITTSTTNGTATFTLDTKAGRRLSQATQAELQAIHDDLTTLQSRMAALMGTATDEPKNVGPEDTDPEDEGAPDGSDADLDESEEQNDQKTTESPMAKSTDATVQELRTRIAEMRATTGIPA